MIKINSISLQIILWFKLKTVKRLLIKL